MRKRYLLAAINEFAFGEHKMAFVSGPRQCGKTTLGKMLASNHKETKYYTWDDIEFRRLWNKSPKSILATSGGKPLVILDEIHKDRTWKRTLKGVYDTAKFEGVDCDIYVTGSAKLNVYRKGSDSLLGRYHHFRLAPFSLREMQTPESLSPDECLDMMWARSISATEAHSKHLDAILKFGPFPDPLFRQSTEHWRIWRRTRHEMIIREDLRDLGTSSDIAKVETLAAILPEKVASPLSINSLRTDIEVSHKTLQKWLGWLKELYFVFEVKPWHRQIERTLKKEGKLYLWDFSEVEDEGARFENLVAMHLLKACNYWTDTGQGDFELFYLRTKEKEEIDFLIVRDKKPWLPIEVKSSETKPSSHWRKFLPMLGCNRAIQIVRPSLWKLYAEGDSELLVAGADEILMYFV